MTSAAPALRRVDRLADTVARHKAGEPVGVYSVCSAHPTVLQAAITQAAADDGYLTPATKSTNSAFAAHVDAPLPRSSI